MSQLTKVKKDHLGLYVIAGGWIARPFFGTGFQENDEVKSHHFGGSPLAGVTTKENNFRRDGIYEMWSTTGISSSEYKQKKIAYGLEKGKPFDQVLVKRTEWYKEYFGSMSVIYEERNKNTRNLLKLKN
jgi:hypothetical protein